MISENNSKAKNQSAKSNKSVMDAKKETPVGKTKGDNGLRKPGSNWERFKNILDGPDPKNSDNPVVKVKRAKRTYRPFNPETECEPQVSQVQKQEITSTTAEKKKPSAYTGLTKAIGIDCEMVGIGNGGVDSMIARVSIVNKNGFCVYDKYVKPTEEVTDFRTAVSGIRPHHLAKGEYFKVVQKEVADILKGRILVGHALHNDLAVLFLSHPKKSQRDTSRYKFFKKITKGNTPSLKKLASELLGIDIQSGEHNSIEDARAAMQLYQLYKRKWELEIKK
ncbi:RNA exonuclease 4 isoform X2 [Copidosoma floridanum]|uniref:RNA exonuclease 4 isoform X2 n=1 Tax=Copidosoma floridanum TaxID=29053 RepID=UPI0006C99F02|nr:RNA exonuclease 4 isoform X2 [Copidosoma floridanum]